MTVRINGNVLDMDNRTDSKYLLTLHSVKSVLSMNGVNTYFGFDANACVKDEATMRTFNYGHFDLFLTRIC